MHIYISGEIKQDHGKFYDFLKRQQEIKLSIDYHTVTYDNYLMYGLDLVFMVIKLDILQIRVNIYNAIILWMNRAGLSTRLTRLQPWASDIYGDPNGRPVSQCMIFLYNAI